MTETLILRALKTTQGDSIPVYSFFVEGDQILRIADITRIERDDSDSVKGFQRKEIRGHVNSIAEFLDQGPTLFPNSLILALSPEVEFKQSRGTKPDGLVDIAQTGTIIIPIREEGKRTAWIVDGQQRAFALAKSKNNQMIVPVVGFVSNDIQVQREQFILVNKAKPLPVRLINELLPETGVMLPRDLATRKIPSELCNLLNADQQSPFHGLIKRVSDTDGANAIITDTALINVIRKSVNDPLGALSAFKETTSQDADIESMYKTMCIYWNSVKVVFPNAWGKPVRASRLMHSAGIQAMGILMDRIMVRISNTTNPEEEIRAALSSIAPHCCWTEGTWDELGLKWNEVQNVPRHIKGLANALVRMDYEASRKAA